MALKKALLTRPSTNTTARVGTWAFIVGTLIAVVAGFFTLGPLTVSLLILLGLIVGFLNITTAETNEFLLATVALVIVAGFGGSVFADVSYVGVYLQRILNAIVVFVVPAAIIVALKTIYSLASDR